jgi:protein-tyrosine phosphatase
MTGFPIDLRMLRQAGVDVIVSALTASEVEDLGLSEEAQGCALAGLVFISFAIEDRSVPTSQVDFSALVNQLLEYSRKGKAIAVHCRAGIGRSSMIAACVLIRNGLSAESAFQAIEESRGCPVPDTPEQRRWVERFSVSTEPRMQ